MRGGALVLLIVLAALVAGCTDSDETYIKQEIEKANYCEADEDCVDTGGKCPFGCYAYVNTDEAQRIRGLIESYNSDCVYSCLACERAVCNSSKCTPICS